VGYRFRGFFSDGDDAVMAAALGRWPFCTAKAITDPFRGFGVRAPDPDSESASDEEYERLLGLPFAVERGLAEFGRRFPAVTFVSIDADCVGGTCVYTGFVAQAGGVRLRVSDVQPGPDPLQQLVGALGVRLQAGYFRPFTRGFW
jgi:hypothetical protein